MGAKYTSFDFGFVYLETPLEEYEYMKIPLKLFLELRRKQYKAERHATYRILILGDEKDHVCMTFHKQKYWLSNKQLRDLKPRGYYKGNTPQDRGDIKGE